LTGRELTLTGLEQRPVVGFCDDYDETFGSVKEGIISTDLYVWQTLKDGWVGGSVGGWEMDVYAGISMSQSTPYSGTLKQTNISQHSKSYF
jgi:hypothetical protein